MSAATPTPVPIPAFAPVERPELAPDEDAGVSVIRPEGIFVDVPVGV